MPIEMDNYMEVTTDNPTEFLLSLCYLYVCLFKEFIYYFPYQLVFTFKKREGTPSYLHASQKEGEIAVWYVTFDI